MRSTGEVIVTLMTVCCKGTWAGSVVGIDNSVSAVQLSGALRVMIIRIEQYRRTKAPSKIHESLSPSLNVNTPEPFGPALGMLLSKSWLQ